jgi:hypothetical protein
MDNLPGVALGNNILCIRQEKRLTMQGGQHAHRLANTNHSSTERFTFVVLRLRMGPERYVIVVLAPRTVFPRI